MAFLLSAVGGLSRSICRKGYSGIAPCQRDRDCAAHTSVMPGPDPGIHHKLATAIIGGAIMLIGIFLWALEGADGYHLHLDKDGKTVDDAHAKH